MKSNLEITTVIGCKNMCPYCPQEKLLNAYKDNIRIMSFETFKKCVDKVPIDSEIHFTGMAEPFLNPDCAKMIEYAFQKGHKIVLSTTLVGLKDISILRKIPFKSFVVHLPSKDSTIPVDEIYLKTLKDLSESGIEISYVYFGTLHPNININIPATQSLMNSRAGNLGGKPRRRKGEIVCKRTQPILLPNGDVVLCCMDYGLKHILGNLLRNNYNDLFSGNEYQNILKGWKNSETDMLCRNCEFAKNVNFTAKLLNSFDFKKTTRRILRKLHLPTK